MSRAFILGVKIRSEVHGFTQCKLEPYIKVVFQAVRV